MLSLHFKHIKDTKNYTHSSGFLENFKRFIQPAMSHKFVNLLTIFCALIGAIYNTWIVIIIEQLGQQIEISSKIGFMTRSMYLILSICLWFVIKLIYVSVPYNSIEYNRLTIDQRYLKRYLQANSNDTERVGTGKMISILQKGVHTRVDMLYRICREQSRTVFTIILTLGYISINGYTFLGLSLLVICVVFVWISIFGNFAHRYRSICKIFSIQVARTQVKWIMAKIEILQNDRYLHEIKKDYTLNKSWYINKIKEKLWQGVAYDGANALGDVIIAVMLILVGLAVIDGSQDFSQYALLASVVVMLSKEIRSIAEIGKYYSDAWIHVEKLWNTFDDFSYMQDVYAGKDLVYMQGDISIKNISYTYHTLSDANKKPIYIFDDFSLDIQGGKKTALVGVSGSGKSTLIKMIAGYLTPNSGSLYIDGQDLKDLSLISYYHHIGYLTQEASIFDGTVLENLTYASSDQVSTAEIEQALSLAKCDFVADLADGVYTEIGERGIRLSGGQRQRLAIAKIFLKNPKIILLDEPTSALDSFSEEAITVAMHNLFQNRTVIIIAHRLQTVKQADDIIVLDAGKIIERGTHTSLIAKNGSYAKMLELQSGF